MLINVKLFRLEDVMYQYTFVTHLQKVITFCIHLCNVTFPEPKVGAALHIGPHLFEVIWYSIMDIFQRTECNTHTYYTKIKGHILPWVGRYEHLVESGHKKSL